MSKFSIKKKGLTKNTSSFLSWVKIQSNSGWGKKNVHEGDFSEWFLFSAKAESCLNTKEKLGSVLFVPDFSWTAKEWEGEGAMSGIIKDITALSVVWCSVSAWLTVKGIWLELLYLV